MAKQIWKNTKVYTGGYDLSGHLNDVTATEDVAEIEATVFGCDAKYALLGLPSVTMSMKGYGYTQASPIGPDDIINDQLRVADTVVTICPTTGAIGEPAKFAKSMWMNYMPGGTVGEMYAFTLDGVGQNTVLVPGTVMESSQKTSSTTGTARLLGAVSATQKLYAAMHVIAVEGTNPTLDMIVASDDAVGFASAATKITFAQATGLGAQFATPVAGAITDTYYRCSWTIGGTGTPKFTVVVSVGIR
jgi:hypothetical protein